MDTRTRFVEPDMACAADAKYLQVNPAGIFYSRFVILAKFINFIFRNGSIRNMNVFFGYVHVVKKVFVHKIPIALHVIFRQGIIFVEVKCDDVFKAQTFFAVHPDQFAVNPDGAGTRCQSQYALFATAVFFADKSGDFGGYFF